MEDGKTVEWQEVYRVDQQREMVPERQDSRLSSTFWIILMTIIFLTAALSSTDLARGTATSPTSPKPSFLSG